MVKGNCGRVISVTLLCSGSGRPFLDEMKSNES